MVLRPILRTIQRKILRPIFAAPIPITQMDLISNLVLQRGVGVATFTRPTIGTFDDVSTELNTTAAIDVARFETNGLLMEGASTNLFRQSDEFNIGNSGSITFVADDAVAPDGTVTADKVTPDSIGNSVEGSAGPGNNRLFKDVAATNGTTTDSVDIKSATGSPVDVGFHLVNRATDELKASTLVTVGNEYQRINVTGITNGANAGFRWVIKLEDAVHMWRGGGELLAFASSRIKTPASAATRGEDSLSIDAANIPAPTENYTVSMEVDILGLDSTKTFTVYSVDGETDRKCEINTTTGLIEATHGAVTVTSTTVMVPGINPEIKVAVDATNITLFVNGVQEAQAIKGTVTGTATAISIGNAAGLNQIYGHVKFFKIFDRAA